MIPMARLTRMYGKSDSGTPICTRTAFSKEVPAGKMTARGSKNDFSGNIVSSCALAGTIHASAGSIHASSSFSADVSSFLLFLMFF